MKIKILSYNIHKGFAWGGAKFVLDKIKEKIIECPADIVFLQEIVGRNQKHEQRIQEWPLPSQCEYLADTIWRDFAYARNAIYTDGHHGNAILSKFPIVEWNQQDISTNPFEKRGILYCNIELPAENFAHGKAQILHAYCLHLNLLHSGRKIQYRSVFERIDRDVQGGDAVVVAGDFNDWNKKSKEVFEEQLHMTEAFKCHLGDYAKTFPARYPILSLDRVYVQNVQVLNVEVLSQGDWRDLSDHAALCVELKVHENEREIGS